MGMVCGCRCCSDVETAKRVEPLTAPSDSFEDQECSDGSDEDGSGASTEVVPSSDGELDPNEYRQDVEHTLKDTGANLKRGKTVAMKEAISTAKKLGVEEEIIQDAEKQLLDHKKSQKRDVTEEEIVSFFESKVANEIPQAERMLKKAQHFECADDVIEKLEKHVIEIIATRPLEPKETEKATWYMMHSCTVFVDAATRGGGRPVVFLNLADGKKTAAVMSLDAPLQNLIIAVEELDGVLQTQITTLRATPAVQESAVRNSKGFGVLDEEDAVSSVALKHQVDGKAGVWCLVEPTRNHRDRLIEALVVLAETCKTAS